MNRKDLEVRRSSEDLIKPKPALLPEDAVERVRVLCVSEDVEAAKHELVPTLKRAGFRVDLIQADLQKSLDLDSKPYQMVLFDIIAPDGLGYQICARQRSASDLPMMLVLHGAARNDVLRGYQLGADAYILAPFDDREFLARVGALLRRQLARWKTI